MGPASKVLIGIGVLVMVSSACGQSSEGEPERQIFRANRMTVYNEGRGNKSKKSRLLRLKLGLKVLALAVLLPLAFGSVMMAAWKGITIALLAFLISVIVGINSLFSGRSRDDLAYANVIVARNPSLQEQLLRRFGGGFPLIGDPVDQFRLPASTLAAL